MSEIVIRDWTPNPREFVGLLRLLRDHYWLDLADQLESQMKPPRIPEPGWGSIVEAGVKEHDERLRWTPIAPDHWNCQNPDEYRRRWDELLDPVLIRDGIGEAS